MTPNPVYVRRWDEIEVTGAQLYSLAARPAGITSAFPLVLNDIGDYVAVTISPKSDIRDVALYFDNDALPVPLIASGICARSGGWRSLRVSTWYPTAWVAGTVSGGVVSATRPTPLLRSPQLLVLRLWRDLPTGGDVLPSTVRPFTALITFSGAGSAPTMFFHLPGVQSLAIGASNDNAGVASAASVVLTRAAPESAEGVNVTAPPAGSTPLATLAVPTGASPDFVAAVVAAPGSNNFRVTVTHTIAGRVRLWLWPELGSAR